jgi:hypothetical protein
VPNAVVSLSLQGSNSAVLVTRTTDEGLFSIGTIRPDLYDLTVRAENFAISKVLNIKIDAAAETSLPPINLKIATASGSINVQTNAADVDTSTMEIDKTVTRSQIEDLPVQDRQVTGLFQTQAGVTNSRPSTVINGMRTTSTNITYDGINIQDNLSRSNTLDQLPNRITIDQVQEATISTTNPNPAFGNGASQVILVTPSGTNSYHGSLYWYNRNTKFAATEWFANQTGAGKAPLNLNQFGGALGGPIKKDKLLFYVNFEGFRGAVSKPGDNIVLTASARQGLLTYQSASGTIRQLNVLQAAGITADPTMAEILKGIPLPNNNNVGDGLNTAGYEINEPVNDKRKSISGKLDYYLSPKHVFSASYNYNTSVKLFPWLASGYFGGPVAVQSDASGKLLSASWRWTPTSRLTNEVRGGFNFLRLPFDVTGQQPAIQSFSFVNLPGIMPGLPQGRNSKLVSLQDNATYVRGKHSISFGYQTYVLHEQPYSASGGPFYWLGISLAAPFTFTPNDVPEAYVGTANNLLATLAGIIGSYSQDFSIVSKNSGYVSNAMSRNQFVYNTYSGYFEDNYKIAHNFTADLGLRYDYWMPVYETDGLLFEPVLENNNPIQTIEDPNAVLNFTGNPGHPFYHAGKKNFSPHAGFAWDILGDGTTSLRGGYSLSFFNDDTIVSVLSAAQTNSGISTSVGNNNAYVLIRDGLPALQQPMFRAPLPIAANYQASPFNSEAVVDPHLRMPYYQQFNFGIERKLPGMVLDVRYVGNHGTRLLQQFDENQVNVYASGFLQDFINAQNNGFFSQAAGLGFNPVYNPGIAGSKPLPVFARLPVGGLMNAPFIANEILQGTAGDLAQLYQIIGLNGPIAFYQNPNELYGRLLTNYGNSTFNSLQTEVRGKLANNLQFQFSYVYGRVLTDAPETAQGNISDLLLLNNGRVERGRASFDLTHVFKGNYIYRVPLGAGHKWMSHGFMDYIFGGWATSAVLTHQSGDPFSILDPIGTLNTSLSSMLQTAMIHGLNKRQLDALVGNRTYVTGNGVYVVNPSIISSLGQGAAPFGSPTYAGEIFFNPGPGQIGNLQINEFSAPWATDVDMSVQKTFRIVEQQSLQFRADFFNVFNHPAFQFNSAANASIQSLTFGKADIDMFGPRLIQFGLHYRF